MVSNGCGVVSLTTVVVLGSDVVFCISSLVVGEFVTDDSVVETGVLLVSVGAVDDSAVKTAEVVDVKCGSVDCF